MKKTAAILILFFVIQNSFAGISYCQLRKQVASKQNRQFKSGNEALRSDTIDVINYSIYLDFTQADANTISGNCEVKFLPLLNVSSITLDLQSLIIDSIVYHGNQVSYFYNDTLLRAYFGSTLPTSLIDSITVYYHGTPQTDPSGWGGFYFTSGYYYNLGVGFVSIPHNFGRVWHPCFDNFVERATYDFTILTDDGNHAYCNGTREFENTIGTDSLLTKWNMSDEIPSYLASVAVSSYTHVVDNYFSISQGINIPIWLAAKPSDTTNLKNSFLHLKDALAGFENYYGPYVWERIGYVLVPFNSGAMEHATNIAYPLATANGNLTFETLMAHELSHHWWGDLVTCETAEEMWINEGMAKYSEHLFTEWVYGYSSYMALMRNNHYDVLHKAHIKDSGYYALNAVPLKYTYGDHSYNKGADVMHTLRSYMGDVNFFNGLKSIQAVYAHKNISSEQFRDELIASTGIDVTDFFNDWILQPGFTHLSISNFIVEPLTTNYKVTIVVSQKLKGASFYHDNIPLEITFLDANWNEYVEQIILTEPYQAFTFQLPTQPVFAGVNLNERINDATTAQNLVITESGTNQLNYANARIVVTNIIDSAFIRVEHNWVYPDVMNVPDDIQISKERYWNIHGVDANKISGNIRFEYNAKTIPSGNFDNQLLVDLGNQAFIEDSIVLLYRPNAQANWVLHDNFTLNKAGSGTDKFGYITANYFATGEYAFGYRTNSVGLSKIETSLPYSIYPNPTTDSVNIDLSSWPNNNYEISIISIHGENVMNNRIKGGQSTTIDLNHLTPGVYILLIQSNKGLTLGSKRLLIQ